MKYIIRAVKYFIYICVFVTIILVILALLHFISSDINVMFKEGWKSIGKIALVFAAISAIYPMFGYRKLMAGVLGELDGLRDDLVKCMEDRGYVLESEDGDTLTFRSRSALNRFFRVWEDRITVTKTLGGFDVEGLSRDVARIVPALEYRFRNPDSE
ncbi:MAG: hypothetical protein J6Y26_02235 [Lachnospiraceae bacterium]|nr:hypothetical protein [Lachnospiraceae bacterium]